MKLMAEDSFEGRVFKIYNRLMFVNPFIADAGILVCAFTIFGLNSLELTLLATIPFIYVLYWVSPTRHVWHFIETYMDVGEPHSVDELFMKKVEPRFGGFGLRDSWEDFNAVFV